MHKRLLSFSQRVHGYQPFLCRTWLSCRTYLRAAVIQQSLFFGCHRASRPRTPLSRIRRRQLPGERLRHGSMRSASSIMICRRGRGWLRPRAARSSSLCNRLAPCCRAALRQGHMQRHGHRLPCYQSVPAVWPVRAVVRNRHVPGHIRLCAYIVQTFVSSETNAHMVNVPCVIETYSNQRKQTRLVADCVGVASRRSARPGKYMDRQQEHTNSKN